MAQCFISDSSRRPMNISEAEMEAKWQAGLPKPEKVVCNECKQPSYNGRYINGKCRKCYNATRVPHRSTFPGIVVK